MVDAKAMPEACQSPLVRDNIRMDDTISLDRLKRVDNQPNT